MVQAMVSRGVWCKLLCLGARGASYCVLGRVVDSDVRIASVSLLGCAIATAAA